MKKKLKRKKKEPTVAQKKAWIESQVKNFQNALGLHQWTITINYDGDWQQTGSDQDTVATISHRINYHTATLTLHKEWLGVLFVLQERLNSTLLHELTHLILAPYHRLILDMRGGWIESIRTLTNDRLTMTSENVTVQVTKILAREFRT